MKKVVLITGASSGIGKETALQLIKEGYVVYGAARRVNRMDDLVELGGHSIEMDITNEDQVASCVQQIIKEQGKIDVLINNAGYAIYGSVEDVTIEDARRQFEVNLFGLARLTQEVLPFMRKEKSGKIINISSIGGKIYFPLGAWYHATKHALEGWSDCLRIETKQFGIDVVIIEPGAISTEFGDVVTGPMTTVAKDGAYEKITRKFVSTLTNLDQKDYSPPSVIADTISKAIKANKPKTRYAVGKLSGSMLFMRRWLSDKRFDKIVSKMIQ